MLRQNSLKHETMSLAQALEATALSPHPLHVIQPETLEKLLLFFQFFLNFSWLNVLIEWVNFFLVMDPWSVATLCEKIAVNNSILAFFLKS